MVFPTQIYRDQLDGARAVAVHDTLARLSALLGLNDLAAPSKPHSAGGIQYLGQGDRESAGSGSARISDAVGHHHQT
jgi:hypothetical protein